MLEINSQEYWDKRFDTDWVEYSGNEQTKFFASVLNTLLPEWLCNEINEYNYSVCDLGCAEGDALEEYRKIFAKSQLYGEDFSKKAIEIARKKYPAYKFSVSDILEIENKEKFPVVICSNVVEHFKDTYNVLKSVCARSENYSIILIPYREKEGAINEHERVFHTKDIPARVEDNVLICAKSVKCDSKYYPYEQLLLVYAKQKQFYLLSDLTEELCSDSQMRCELEISRLEETNREYQEQMRLCEENCKTQVSVAESNARQLLDEQKAQYEELLSQKKLEFQHQAEENSRQLLSEQKAQYEELLSQKELEFQNRATELQNALDEKMQELEKTAALVCLKDGYLKQIQDLCDYYCSGKMMKLQHLIARIKLQLIKGNKEDRQAFWAWRKARKNKNWINNDKNPYSPWHVVKEKLQEAYVCKVENPVSTSKVSADAVIAEKQCLDEHTCKILKNDYKKHDVIILSVIDYNFRHQRPQHFATRFAENGHRVYYVNANFIRCDSIKQESDNLYVVDFRHDLYNAIYAMNGKDTLEWMESKLYDLVLKEAIRDAVVIVDYPNWVYVAESLRRKYGFGIVTDYMDDYTGFLGTAEDFLKENCIRLLKSSDLVVASSQFLHDVAVKYTSEDKITIIRNGTEVSHFYQAVALEHKQKDRKIIGYYGAVSHWFAWEKVCYLAKTMPECDIVIVGDITEHRDKLEKYSNIKLLGEKPYQELPDYLADFDVCLIPFDTSTDLIKATNPVKFYEYLSAGKKVVATEIPELMPFKDEYVYMSNDNEEFASYVQLCLEGKDQLKSAQLCIEFAKDNDWQKRFEHFSAACIKMTPKVSVIVLTYNNLNMNKNCIESILNKTAYSNYELIVVDNQSTDGTVEYLRNLESQNIPNVKIIFNDDNLGFAGGNNCGIQVSDGDYVILLNNDTIVSRGWITSMVKHMEQNPEYGMCNPVTNSIGNESMIAVEYHNEYEMDLFAYNYTAQHMGELYSRVDRLPLFATIIRKKMIDQIGMLDDAYKVGMFEDDDYAELVKSNGYGLSIVEDAFIHHINNGSFKKLEDETYKKIFEANKAIFEKKWNKTWTMPEYREGVSWDTNMGMGV